MRRAVGLHRPKEHSALTTGRIELKARHRAMWASGDYPSDGRDVPHCRSARASSRPAAIGPGMRVLDVAAGTGNAAIPAAAARRRRRRERPHARAASRPAAGARPTPGVELEWVEADAEHLPFEDASFDVVISSIGVMFAPHHQAAADELVRVCRPGGTHRPAELDARGHARRAVPRPCGRSCRRPRPAPSPPPLWGSEDHLRELFGDRVDFHTLAPRACSRSPRSSSPRDYAEHFKARYGPTIAARANAEQRGPRRPSSTRRSTRFCDEWNRGTPDAARFEKEYLLAVGHPGLAGRVPRAPRELAARPDPQLAVRVGEVAPPPSSA